MDHICEAGFDCFHFDSKVDARDAVAKIAGWMSLMGNVNNPEALLNGTPEEVAALTRYAVEAGVNVVGPECAIPLRTPLGNLRAIAGAVAGQTSSGSLA
jgi:uroporphyrinogen-III decarboxylase